MRDRDILTRTIRTEAITCHLSAGTGDPGNIYLAWRPGGKMPVKLGINGALGLAALIEAGLSLPPGPLGEVMVSASSNGHYGATRHGHLLQVMVPAGGDNAAPGMWEQFPITHAGARMLSEALRDFCTWVGEPRAATC